MIQTIKKLIPPPLRPVAKYIYRQVKIRGRDVVKPQWAEEWLTRIDARLTRIDTSIEHTNWQSKGLANGFELMESRFDRLYANMIDSIASGSSQREGISASQSKTYPCIVCERGRAEARFLVGGAQYVECDNCHFLFVLGDRNSGRFGRDLYSSPWRLTEQASWLGHERIAAFRTLLNIGLGKSGAKKARVLDFGSGTENLQEKSKLYDSIDFYDPYLEDERLSSYEAIRKRRYDLILCTEVLEHVVHPIGMMEQMASLMADETVCIATTLLHDYKFNLAYLNPAAGHISIHSRKSLGLLANGRGLSHSIEALPESSGEDYFHVFRRNGQTA